MTKSPDLEQARGPSVSRMAAAALGLAAAILLWRLSEVVLIVFASVLIAIALRGAAEPIARVTRIPDFAAILLATFGVIAVIGLSLSLFGARLLTQYDEIARDIPKALASIRQAVEAHPWGRFIETLIAGADLSKATAPVAIQIASFIGTIGQALSYATFMLFGGFYLAIDPHRYINGLIHFTPADHRERLGRFLDLSGATLRLWLLTQLLVMAINGAFAGLGLWAAGVEAPVALALIAGALSFIPYVGTIVAMAIAALSALPQGADFALYALIVLGGVSFVEGYLITPYVQSRTLSLPPVALIFSMLAFALLFGSLGVILAAPLTIILMVALDVLTGEKQPGERVAPIVQD